MALIVLFVIVVLVLYAVVCLIAGAVCGCNAYKNDVVYYSVSGQSAYTRLTQYLARYPEVAERLVCINNLEDENLSAMLKEDAEKYGFSIIGQ